MEWFWFGLILFAILIVVVIAVIVETRRKETTSSPPPPTENPPTLGGMQSLTQTCQNNEVCGPGLNCVTRNGMATCLARNGERCSLDAHCESNYCFRTNNSIFGTCQTLLSPPSQGSKQIWCWNGSEWATTLTVPANVNPTSISSSQHQRLVVDANQQLIYLFDGTSWRNISSTLTPPGTLIDATFLNGQMLLLYRLSTGQTPIYSLNGSSFSSPISPLSTQNQAITGKRLVGSTDGTLFLIGMINGGQETIFRRSPNETLFSPLVPGSMISISPDQHGLIFLNGKTISSLNGANVYLDNLNGELTSLVLTPNGEVWYILNGQLYQQRNLISPPFTISTSSRLYYDSLTNRVCLIA